MNESSDNVELLNGIRDLMDEISNVHVDENRRSLAEFHLKYNELAILDEVDALLAERYANGHGVIDVFMENPRVALEYFRMQVMQFLDVKDMSAASPLEIKETIIMAIASLVYAVRCAECFEQPVSRPYEAPMKVRTKPEGRPAAAKPIKPFGKYTLPTVNERLEEFKRRMGLHATERQNINPTQEGFGSTMHGLADAFTEASKITITESNNEPDPRFQNLPIDEQFEQYVKLGEPDELIPDNPNKKPLIIMPDAQEVKDYAATHSGPIGNDQNDNGLVAGPKRRATKRRGSSGKEDQ